MASGSRCQATGGVFRRGSNMYTRWSCMAMWWCATGVTGSRNTQWHCAGAPMPSPSWAGACVRAHCARVICGHEQTQCEHVASLSGAGGWVRLDYVRGAAEVRARAANRKACHAVVVGGWMRGKSRVHGVWCLVFGVDKGDLLERQGWLRCQIGLIPCAAACAPVPGTLAGCPARSPPPSPVLDVESPVRTKDPRHCTTHTTLSTSTMPMTPPLPWANLRFQRVIAQARSRCLTDEPHSRVAHEELRAGTCSINHLRLRWSIQMTYTMT